MGSDGGTRRPAAQAVHTEAAPAAIGPYSAGVRTSAGGGLVFVSGQLPLDPLSGQMVEGDVGGLVRRALANGLAIAEAAGSSLEHIVKVTVFLTNLDDFGPVNEAYAEFFGDWHPARSVVEVSRLPRDSPLEVEMIAVLAGVSPAEEAI
jgi:2-iminobutanoate/2-iminopropanoate deaminase